MNFNIAFLKTQSVSDTIYIDLIAVGEHLTTFAMEKIQEPNIFGIKEQVDGDSFDEFVEKYGPSPIIGQ